MKDAKEFSQRLKNLVMATAFSATGTPQTELEAEVEVIQLDARIAGLGEAAKILRDQMTLTLAENALENLVAELKAFRLDHPCATGAAESEAMMANRTMPEKASELAAVESPNDKNAANTRLLSSITDAELDHLSLGMEHNFGATITRPKEFGGKLLIIETEDGTRISIAAECTEMDAWKIAEAAFS